MAGRPTSLVTIVVAGRNDDYGKDFRERLFRTARHNSDLFRAAGIAFEYVLAEWNPLPDRALLSEEFVSCVPHARAVVIPSEVHRKYTLNPQMPFHEMPAKNAALRRAKGDVVIVTNADILFSESLVQRIADGFSRDTLYRAHRIDVKPELSWEEIQNPLNQLPSGEGLLPPPRYLGAGGDFCLASRELWHRLRGFDERVRFSTRAKDWQFFLSAMAQGARIEFIGDVYHLDHEGGFRNTSPDDLKDDRVHFGKWWDIEFGLPVANSEDWGFRQLREDYPNNGRIAVLESDGYAISDSQNRADCDVMSWITRPVNTRETQAAVLLHVICAAHHQKTRLICRLKSSRLAATLSGFDVVARRFGVEIYSNCNWPQPTGYHLREFAAEPATLTSRDWILEEVDGDLRVHAAGAPDVVDVLPRVLQINDPEFNPVLARRLLRAYLELQRLHKRGIVICGGGSHTKDLLNWGIPDHFVLVDIVDSRSLGLVESREDIDAVLLSSASFESDLAEACRERNISNVIALYGDWPADMRAEAAGDLISISREQGCLV